MQQAFDAERLILTEDKDFGALVVKAGLAARGIILLRTTDASTAFQLRRLSELFSQRGAMLGGHFTVVTDTTFRVRPI